MLLFYIAISVIISFDSISASNLSCRVCNSSTSWDDCDLESSLQPCSANTNDDPLEYQISSSDNETTLACYRVELEVAETGESHYRHGCTTQPDFCTSWNTSQVSIRQCSFCPEDDPQNECLNHPTSSEESSRYELQEGDEIEVKVTVGRVTPKPVQSERILEGGVPEVPQYLGPSPNDVSNPTKTSTERVAVGNSTERLVPPIVMTVKGDVGCVVPNLVVLLITALCGAFLSKRF